MKLRSFLPAVVLCAFAVVSFAAEESMLPAFGPAGADFTVNAKDGNKTTGWLPKDWVDNTEWAAVSATYSKLNDPPKEGVTAVRIKVAKVDEGQLQLTSWARPKFKKGSKYVISGWIRSPDNSHIKIGVRQTEDPWELFAEQDVSASNEWKPFTFEFSFTEDKEAHVMFIKQETGTVDLGGLEVREKK